MTLPSSKTRFKKPNNGNAKYPQSAKKSNIKRSTSYSYPMPESEPFCVWLGNLPATATSSDVVKYLEPMKIEPRDIRFGRVYKKGPYRCAFVDFYNKEDMRMALESISSPDAPLFMDRLIEIDINVSKASKPSPNGSSFRPVTNNPVTSKQDVRSFENNKSPKDNHQNQTAQPTQPHVQPSVQSQGANLSNDRFQTNLRGRGRGRDKGRRGRRSDYFRGQYGRYKQKNENFRASFSNPSFSDNLPQQKPVKILKRPKESTVPIVSPKTKNESNKMNGAHHKKSQSLPITPNVNKSRFPTMAEDKVRINPMLNEYINGNSNAHKNDNANNANKSQYASHNNDYHNEHDSYYYNKTQRHSGTVQSQQYHQHGSYKQKRHRNNHRNDQQQQQQRDDYYSAKSNYKNKSYHEDRPNSARYKGSNKSYRGRGRGHGRGNRSYSKKRHNNYSYQ